MTNNSKPNQGTLFYVGAALFIALLVSVFLLTIYQLNNLRQNNQHTSTQQESRSPEEMNEVSGDSEALDTQGELQNISSELDDLERSEQELQSPEVEFEL